MKYITILICIFFFSTSHAANIEYEIYEISSGKLIAKGIKEYDKSDIIADSYRAFLFWKATEKYVELQQGFKVGARIFKKSKLRGFGLVAQLTEKDFSWEWYNRLTDNMFQKLQGKQLARVRVSGSPKYEILEEIEFLDDTKLSFSLGGAGKDESHDIIIKKGSVLKFD